MPASPAAFVTPYADWKAGDTIVTRAGRLRIVEIDPEVDPELRAAFDAVWVVERVAPTPGDEAA